MVSHRCLENGSMVLGRDNCQKGIWRHRQILAAWAVESSTFSPSFQMKDGQECRALVTATGAAPSQPLVSSQSHLVDRGSLTQSLSLPEEAGWQLLHQPLPLSRAGNRCSQLSVSTLVLSPSRNFSLLYFSVLLEGKKCFETGVVKEQNVKCWHACWHGATSRQGSALMPQNALIVTCRPGTGGSAHMWTKSYLSTVIIHATFRITSA